jgi:polysaccharide biosynthesis protein PslH
VKILWIKTELLHPVDKGGRIRTYQMLRALARHHHIVYLALDDGTPGAAERAAAAEYCAVLETVPFRPTPKGTVGFLRDVALNLLSPRPYVIDRYRVPALTERIRRVVREQQIDLVVCDFLAASINVPDDLGVPIVLFQHNVETMIWERHAQVAANPLTKFYFGQQAARMRRFERDDCARYDLVIAVSENDADVFRREMGIRHVAAVPTGVDIDYFALRNPADVKPGTMVFTGSMDWMPNEDGMAWFTSEILPKIQQQVPGATLAIVGRNPSAKVRSLHNPEAGVVVTGSVPDVRPYLASAAVFIVPLRVGGGTRLKIFEGMAMGLPTVSTTIGAEGLQLVDGEHLQLADTADTFAAACTALLADTAAATALATRGQSYVRTTCSWDGVSRTFAELCASTARAYRQS